MLDAVTLTNAQLPASLLMRVLLPSVAILMHQRQAATSCQVPAAIVVVCNQV